MTERTSIQAEDRQAGDNQAGDNGGPSATSKQKSSGEPRQGSSLPQRRASGGVASLDSGQGKTRIADTVVAKIAAMATREIPGVYSLGRGFARRMGSLRSMVPGQAEGQSRSTQGVAVEVGEKEAAVDLDVVTWYGESIVEVTGAVRQNVISRVEAMTGLSVVEVNINVDDIHLDDDEESSPPAEPRVQ